MALIGVAGDSDAFDKGGCGGCRVKSGAFHFLGLCFPNPNPNLNLNLRPFRAKATEIKIKRGTQKSEMRPVKSRAGMKV
jgi:hypothetical protein